MTKRIAIIQGHPDPRGNRFGHALADAYAKGAEQGGHEVRRIKVSELDFPILRTKEDYEQGQAPPSIQQCQETIRWAEHLVFFYPPWMGAMPALLKAFLEQVFRPGFAYSPDKPAEIMWKGKLSGKSARIVITMGMPAFFYRWYFRAHSLKSLERNVLSFIGIKPIKESLVGMVEAKDAGKREAWLEKMSRLGRAGS